MKKNKVYPLRLNDQSCEKTIDLFFYQKDNNSHYSLIKNFSRLFSSLVSKDARPKYYCKRCIQHYTKPKLLQKHIQYCSRS